ncbi:MAG: hypothetical protein AB8B72_09000 [Crocinitomicaceae bacterium]
MTKINLASCTIEKIKDKLILVSYKDDYYVNLVDAIEIKETFETLIPEGDIFAIINLQRRFLQVSQEAQKFLGQDSPLLPRIKGVAMVLNNLPSRLIIKFFINHFKPSYPSEVFKNATMAKKWLETIGL